MSNLPRLLVLAALAIPTHALADQSETRVESATSAEASGDGDKAMTQAVILRNLVDFEPQSARVYSASREKIQKIAQTWRSTGALATITVHGYSDSMDSRLAQHRANRIRVYLVRYGVDADKVVTVGHSLKESPNAKLGRRAELVVGNCDAAPLTCRAFESKTAMK